MKVSRHTARQQTGKPIALAVISTLKRGRLTLSELDRDSDREASSNSDNGCQNDYRPFSQRLRAGKEMGNCGEYRWPAIA